MTNIEEVLGSIIDDLDIQLQAAIRAQQASISPVNHAVQMGIEVGLGTAIERIEKELEG